MRPLLRRTRLMPSESLSSLLERLALRNYYPGVRTITQICDQQRKLSLDRDNLACPNRMETFVQIAQLTGIAPEALFNASPHRFAPLLTSYQQIQVDWIEEVPKTILSPTNAQNYLHPISVAQYCPVCLKVSAYHHLDWIPVATTMCPEHLCLLVKACPRCGAHLSVQEVVRRRCRACWADLCTAQAGSVAEDVLSVCAQRILRCWFLEKIPDPQWLFRCGFPTATPSSLYHLLENLLKQILTCQKEWSILPDPFNSLAKQVSSRTRCLHRLSPKQIYSLYKVAFTGLMNWPQGLFQVLDAYGGYFLPHLTASTRLQRLEQIQQEWALPAWQERDYDFLQEAFASYLQMRNLSEQP